MGAIADITTATNSLPQLLNNDDKDRESLSGKGQDTSCHIFRSALNSWPFVPMVGHVDKADVSG